MVDAASADRAERSRAERAGALLGQRDLLLTRATRAGPLTHLQASALVEAFLRFPVLAVGVEIVRAAMATRERFSISYWDAAILEAARAGGCDVVLSEDLSDGADYGGVRVENPFA